MEPTFLLMYYMGFTYSDVRRLPVIYKRWFVERLNKELSRGESSNNETIAITRDPKTQTPEMRAMAGLNRAVVPHRLTRMS